MTSPSLALALLLQVATPTAPEAQPSYPLGPGTSPDVETPGQPFRLTDLAFGLVDDRGTTQSFAARFKTGGFAYLGVEAQGERRTLSLLTRRGEARVCVTDGSLDAALSFRTSRFILSADLVENHRLGEPGYVFGPGIALRLTSGLELLGGIETDSRKPADRTLSAFQAGALFQSGTSFEATGLVRRERVPTAAPESRGTLAVNTVDTATGAVIGQLGAAAELYASALLRDTSGRFGRTEWGGTAGTRVAMAPRLRAEAEVSTIQGDGAMELSRGYRGRLTWFARRQTLPRSGEAPRRSAALARQARDLGENERRTDQDGERREQRLRLALTGRAEDLAENARALYEAQVSERDVPVLGAEIVDEADRVPGTETRTARIFVGVPWPPSPPWRENPGAVPFLRFDLARERLRTSFDHESVTYSLSLAVSLNREMDGIVRWSRVEPTSLDIIHDLGRRETVELFFTYAFAR